MKKVLVVFAMFMMMTAGFAQKLKGSRIVTTEQREIGDFENIEVENNIEVFLASGENSEIEIDADDNLHKAITIDLSQGTLRIGLNQEVTGAKKLSVKVTYTSNLKMIIVKEAARITGLTDISLDNLTIKSFGNSKIYSNIRAKVFTLMANDKSHIEMNLNSDNATIELSNNAYLKALISAPRMKFDMYQKSSANVEGDITDLTLRLDNNTTFTGKNLTAKNAAMVIEGFAKVSLNVASSTIIEASGKADIELSGEPRIELTKFTDNASLRKKQKKA